MLRLGKDWPLRLAGSLFGLGCCALGQFSIFGGSEQLPELNRERAAGFGTAAIVVGLVALIGSLTGDAPPPVVLHAAPLACVPRRRAGRLGRAEITCVPFGSRQRMTPAQTLEGGEVAIGRDQPAAPAITSAAKAASGARSPCPPLAVPARSTRPACLFQR